MKTNEKNVEGQATEQTTATVETKEPAAEQPVEDPEFAEIKKEFNKKIQAFHAEMAEMVTKSKGRLGIILCGCQEEGEKTGITLAVSANGEAQTKILMALKEADELKMANMLVALKSLKSIDGLLDLLK